MTRRSKIAAGVAVTVAGLAMLGALAAILVMRSAWFSDYVREKIVAAIEDSTGGRVDLKSFSFDWHTLTATARGLVIHGTEPAGAAPLFEAPVIVLRVKLFTAFERIVDLESLRIEQPAANVIVYSNGETNLPTSKVVRASRQTGLERIVDLAIHRLDIANGSIQFHDRKIAFSAHGADVRIEWLYDPASVQYRGDISIRPLHLASDSSPPLDTNVHIPITIARNAILISNATLASAQSNLTATAHVQNLAAPIVDGQLSAHLALNEFARSFHLPIYPAPNQAADISLSMHADPGALEIHSASIGLDASHLELAGDLRAGADVHAVLSLQEWSDLLRIPQQPEGSVEIAGTAIYKDSQYSAAGTIDGAQIGFRGLPARLSGIAFTSSFQVDRDRIAVSDLNLSALGGKLSGSAQVSNLNTLTAAISLRDFTIRGLSSALARRPIDYGGAISGTIEARGSLRSPDARATLNVTPQAPGVPVSGRLQATYSGAARTLALDDSHLNLPHTLITLHGQTARQAEFQITSRSLHDLQPAFALASSRPVPVSLDGGEARFDARLKGPLTAPSISGSVLVSRFSVSGRTFDRLAANFSASPSGAALTAGTISHGASIAQFAGSLGLQNWQAAPYQPLAATVTIRNGDLADAVALAGRNPAGTRGALTADARVSGTVGDPQGSIQAAAIQGAIRDQPFDRLALDASLTDQLITLNSLQAIDGAARLDARGSFAHPRDSIENGQLDLHLQTSRIPLSQFRTLDQWRPGLEGTVDLHADLRADLSSSRNGRKIIPRMVNANLAATDLRDRSRTFGDLTASAITQGSAVRTDLRSNFAGSSIQWSGVTELTGDYPTTAQASIRALPIEPVLALVDRESIPAKGTLSADAHLSGSIGDPRATVSFDLTHANLFAEPIDRAAGSLDYSNRLINVSSLEISALAGRMNLRASFAHPPSSFDSGELTAHLATSVPQLQRSHVVEQWKPGLRGSLQVTADATVKLQTTGGRREWLPSSLAANASFKNLSVDDHALGGLTLDAGMAGGAVNVKLDSDLGKSSIHGNASIALAGNYPARGTLSFASLTYSGFSGLFTIASAPDGFEAAAGGTADFSGPLLQPAALSGNLRLSQLEISSTGVTSGKRIALQNDGPLVAHLNHSTVAIDHARLNGPLTHLALDGTAGFLRSAPLNLAVHADTDFSVVKQFFPESYSGGTVTLTSTIHGSLSSPVVNGQIVFRNASLQLASWPNGIYNTNGTVLLNGRTATIQSFSAESGGGKISAGGFIGFAGAHLTYDVHADARAVRVRYSGASVLASGNVNLSGTSQRSVLGGRITIERFAYSQQTDLGSILSGTGAVPPAQAANAGLLASTRLNIRVVTAPDLQFQTSAAQELAATADLTVTGTLASPGMTGRINVTEGNLLFFGNKYTVNRGAISFYDSLAIRPIVDIDLQTLVQGVTVDISVSGPIENLKLSYHSDPPLRFEDIIALLAAGTTPPDPTIAAQQPTQPDQSAAQMGESALLGQAIANPVASRLQRVFGVSQLKVAPEFVTGSALPQARVTIQQQISPSVIFTYSQDLSQSNSQLLRIEWDLTPRFSAVAERDENGIFGIDFFYRKQFR